MKFVATIRNKGLNFAPEVRERFVEYLSENEGTKLEITTPETKASRKFLEGAVVDIYCEHKYNIPRRQKNRKQKRMLFYRDFNFDIITNKDGDPIKVPKESSKGMAQQVLKAFNEYAIRDMCPVPNPELHKTWNKKYSMDLRFDCYYDWLDFLEIEVDAMPTNEIFKKLYEEKVEYPEGDFDPNFDNTTS